MRAAFYECDITPPLGGYMEGYGFERLATDVYDRLYAKAFVIENNDSYAVMISLDADDMHDEIYEKATKRIYEYTGISPECVCICASHTHTGAPVTDSPEIKCFADMAYKDVAIRLIADSAILAYKRLQECSASFSLTRIDGVSYCRDSYMKDGTIRSWISDVENIERDFSEPDKDLSILMVEANGKKIGAIYNFSCHLDTVKDRPYGYSGDYAAQVSKCLKEKYGNDFVSVYLPGPAGDINHINRYTNPPSFLTHREIGSIIADGFAEAVKDGVRVEGDIRVAREKITVPKKKFTQEEFEELLREYLDDRSGNFIYNNLTHYYATTKEFTKDVYLQVIAIGDLGIYTYPGEMFVDYSHRTKESSPYAHTMVVQESNAFGGYVAPPRAYVPGSKLYEIRAAYSGPLAPEASEMLYDKVIELGEKIK